ncbi:hypothetical protein KIN20_024163 [Parelaphostrongylus tenuis]|uniref:Uncharacterized protein n=1 Tax=Parelaphostrongylus tenuis TaxID=148309 RepID=A0AAD5MXW0_PARTN|nr:hypothetical protein KIN20_024163 [Parelaphostrongylus tenuis]
MTKQTHEDTLMPTKVAGTLVAANAAWSSEDDSTLKEIRWSGMFLSKWQQFIE